LTCPIWSSMCRTFASTDVAERSASIRAAEIHHEFDLPGVVAMGKTRRRRFAVIVTPRPVQLKVARFRSLFGPERKRRQKAFRVPSSLGILRACRHPHARFVSTPASVQPAHPPRRFVAWADTARPLLAGRFHGELELIEGERRRRLALSSPAVIRGTASPSLRLANLVPDNPCQCIDPVRLFGALRDPPLGCISLGP